MNMSQYWEIIIIAVRYMPETMITTMPRCGLLVISTRLSEVVILDIFQMSGKTLLTV